MAPLQAPAVTTSRRARTRSLRVRHPDLPPLSRPSQDLPVEPQVGPQTASLLQSAAQGGLHVDQPGPGVQQPRKVPGGTQGGETPPDLIPRQGLNGQPVNTGALLDSFNQRAAGLAQAQHPRPGQQVAAALPGQALPKLQRPLHQRHVVGVLGIEGAKGPGLASVAPLLVGRRPAVETNHRGPPAGQLQGREASHGPQADNGHVETWHACSLFASQLPLR